jgi:hypothetical protein
MPVLVGISWICIPIATSCKRTLAVPLHFKAAINELNSVLFSPLIPTKSYNIKQEEAELPVIPP